MRSSRRVLINSLTPVLKKTSLISSNMVTCLILRNQRLQHKTLNKMNRMKQINNNKSHCLSVILHHVFQNSKNRKKELPNKELLLVMTNFVTWSTSICLNNLDLLDFNKITEMIIAWICACAIHQLLLLEEA